ncbi:MAG: hypothetical protein WAK82_07865, partial [Streptosporangiaceae bacterium]
ELDPAAVRAVLDAPDPVAAGVAVAARQAQALLDIPGVAGVNISGLASARGYEFAARVKAEVAERIRAEQQIRLEQQIRPEQIREETQIREGQG